MDLDIRLHSRKRNNSTPCILSLHKAMSSDIFGLVVSNIGLKHSRPLLESLRAELKRNKKKCYTLSVGRINPAKLANFEGVECFVLVGCAEGGLVDSKVGLKGAGRD
jgi:diphthamide biosynthesis protein 2